MNLETTVFRYPFKLYTHKRGRRTVPVSEVDFVEGLPFESGCPMWLNFTIFDIFFAAGDQVEPVAVKR